MMDHNAGATAKDVVRVPSRIATWKKTLRVGVALFFSQKVVFVLCFFYLMLLL